MVFLGLKLIIGYIIAGNEMKRLRDQGQDRVQLLKTFVCHDMEDKLETGSHQRATSRAMTLSHLGI